MRRSFPMERRPSTSTWSMPGSQSTGAAKDRAMAFQAELTVTLRPMALCPGPA